jgi:hypothetical protein
MKVLIFQHRPSRQNYITFTFSNLDNFMQNMTNASQIVSRRNVFHYHFYLLGVNHGLLYIWMKPLHLICPHEVDLLTLIGGFQPRDLIISGTVV